MVKAGKAKPHTRLWWIGLWATIWWAVSGLWVVGLFLYKYDSTLVTQDALLDSAIVIVGVWGIGALVWLDALKKAKISTKAGLKDLFLTIRR